MPAFIKNLNTIDPRTRGKKLWAWYSAKWVNGLRGTDPAADAALAQWNDLSDYGNHLVQGTGANQPVFKINSGPDGRFPSVLFADSTDTMTVALAGVQPRPITVVAVWKNLLADDAANHPAATVNAARIGVGINWTGATNAFSALDDAAAAAPGLAGDNTTWHVESFVARTTAALGSNPSRSTLSTDGVHTDVAGLAGTNTNSNIAVGTFNMSLAELQIYFDVFSLSEEDGLLRSLASDWGIPLSQLKFQK